MYRLTWKASLKKGWCASLKKGFSLGSSVCLPNKQLFVYTLKAATKRNLTRNMKIFYQNWHFRIFFHPQAACPWFHPWFDARNQELELKQTKTTNIFPTFWEWWLKEGHWKENSERNGKKKIPAANIHKKIPMSTNHLKPVKIRYCSAFPVEDISNWKLK